VSFPRVRIAAWLAICPLKAASTKQASALMLREALKIEGFPTIKKEPIGKIRV